MKSLVVEDDLTNRLLLQTFLAQYGDCHVALNGKEAVKAFQLALDGDKHYDLICMDLIMPEMDGHQAVRLIRSLERKRGVRPPAQAKIIMTTALSDRSNIIMSAREECDAYLVKPIDTGKLLNHLQSFGLLKEKQASP